MQIPGYKILRKINQGGMSTVYLAIQLSVGREVALKVMSPVLNADPVFGERFQREANIVGQLSHPNIVSIYDIGRYKGLNYIAMDYLPGGTVHEKMVQGLDTAGTLSVLRQIAHALDVAHRKGYVHRDIKPENILFRDDGTAVLTDFGVAKAASASTQVTNAGTVVGTPHYMSPEQSRGMPLDGRSDLYSLGVVLYEMLTGSVPFQGEESVAIAIKHLTEPVPKLPGQHAVLQPLIDKLLAKNANDRFQTGAELVAAIDILEETLSGFPNRKTPYTDPASMNVMALFKALVLTSIAALRIKWMQLTERLFSWRWTPSRGLYKRPQVNVTEVYFSSDPSLETRDTVVSTRVRKAAHYQEVGARQISIITRFFTIVLILGVMWSAFSVGFTKLIEPRHSVYASGMGKIIHVTASVIESYADELLGRDQVAIESPPATPSIPTIVEQPAPQQQIEPEAVDTHDSSDVTDVTDDEPPTVTELVTYHLNVTPKPNNARIRVLNIKERFHQGMRLEPGRYLIETSRPGYITEKQWININDEDYQHIVSLKVDYQPGDKIRDTLADGSQAPSLVVVPTGEFLMGHKGEANASPQHSVSINTPFAIGQFEVTFVDYDKFAKATSRPLPSDNNWGRANRPVINVSWQDAYEYTQWLSQQTGAQYRLPSESEWEYIHRGGTETNYWWGNGKPEQHANCKRGCDSDYTSLFKAKTAPVGSFPANRYAVMDTAGNVAEWTLDCYQPHYMGAPTDGQAVENESCTKRAIRGGAANDSAKKLFSYSRDGEKSHTTSEWIGFRILRELN
ncbi:hypothetical protein NBRC116494_14960 [Aurantivibrio plasticivorans]